jgi:hypothetical protein
VGEYREGKTEGEGGDEEKLVGLPHICGAGA